MAAELALLTHSRLDAFRTCPRLHQYAYTKGYRPVHTAEPLTFGTVGHECLKSYFLSRKAKRPMDAWLEDALDPLDQFELNEFVRAKIEVLVIGYASFYDAMGMDVLEVEREFRLPLINPESGRCSRTFELAGKIDAIARFHADNRVGILEHKFTTQNAAPGGAYRERLQMDGQVSQYFLGANSIGYDAACVVYDVVHKPKQKPLEATPIESRRYTKAGVLYANQRDRDETLEEYRTRLVEAVSAEPLKFYQQVEVVRLEDEMREYQWDVWQTAARIRESERTGFAEKYPNNCARYGSMCGYWPVCTRKASIEDASMYRKKSRAHEELDEEEGEEQ